MTSESSSGVLRLDLRVAGPAGCPDPAARSRLPEGWTWFERAGYPVTPAVRVVVPVPDGWRSHWRIESTEDAFAPCAYGDAGSDPLPAVMLDGSRFVDGVQELDFFIFPFDGRGTHHRHIQMAIEGNPAAADWPRRVESLQARPGAVRIGAGWQDRIARTPGDLRRAASDAYRLAAKGQARMGAPASTVRVRIPVKQDGLYAMTGSWLSGQGISLAGVDPRELALWCQGVEVPILINGESDGVMDAGDTVFFYGQALIGEEDGASFNGADFTDENVYWLYRKGAGPARVASRSGAPVNGYSSVLKTRATARLEVDDRFLPTPHVPGGDRWYMLPFLSAASGSTFSQFYSLNVPSPYTGGGAVDPQFHAEAMALSTTAHLLNFRLSGLSPTAGSAMSWSTKTYQSGDFTFALAALGAGGTLSLEAYRPSAASGNDTMIPNLFTLQYDRQLVASAGSLDFGSPNVPSRYAVSALPTSAIQVWDISETLSGATRIPIASPVLVTGATVSGGAGNYTATFEVPALSLVNGTQHHLLTTTAILTPASATSRPAPLLTGAGNSAAYLIIGQSDHLDLTPGGSLDLFKSQKALSAGPVRVVDVADIYDTFSDGLFDPRALRAFLEEVYYNWTPDPGVAVPFVLLLGDATYDYKDSYQRVLTETSYKNWTPIMNLDDALDQDRLGYYASDTWYGDVYPQPLAQRDNLSEFDIGRLPGRTLSEINAMFDKSRVYETSALTGNWRARTLLCADETDDPGEEDFVNYQDALATAYLGSPYVNQKLYYGQAPYSGTDFTTYATDLRTALTGGSSNGVAMFTYIGHGSFKFWSQSSEQLFTSDLVRNGNTQSDITLMGATSYLPFSVNFNCITAAIHEASTFDPLLEALVKAPGKGAVGALGPTGLSYLSAVQLMINGLFDQRFGAPSRSAAVADLHAAAVGALPAGSKVDILGHLLLGDPALVLKHPEPNRVTDLGAAAGNAVVNLSWTSPDAAATSYDVYRATSSSGPWSLLGNTTFLAWADNTAVNATNYWYAVRTRNAGGFVAGNSNVVSATPLNPNPPAAPSGVAAADLNTGVSVRITWSPNPETDLNGYRVYWGTSSGVYASDSGWLSKTATLYDISGLTEGVTIYAVVKARNTSGLISGNSTQVSATPRLILGRTPTSAPSGMTVARDGNDLLIHFTHSGLNVYGNSDPPVSYTLYRAANRYDFTLASVPTGGSEAKWTITDNGGSDIDPAANAITFRDAGAFVSASNLSYLATATGADGFESGSSHEAPKGCTDLQIHESTITPDRIGLTFTIPTLDMAGQPTIITKFRVYRATSYSAPPFTGLYAEVNLPYAGCESYNYCIDEDGSPMVRYDVTFVDNRGIESPY